jgi:hypothetical protein
VGPVAHAYEHHGPLARRLNDEGGRGLAAGERLRPWAASYLATAPTAPPLAVAYSPEGQQPDRATVRSSARLGAVTIDLMDHHRRVLRSVTRPVGPGAPVVFKLRAPAKGWAQVRAARIRVGAFSHFEDLRMDSPGDHGMNVTLGAMAPKEEPTAPPTP